MGKEIKKYKLGIMSSVWYVEAPSVDVASVALILYLKTNAPVANYSSNGDGSQEQSQFFMAGMDGTLTDKIGEFMAHGDNPEKVRAAYQTITEAAMTSNTQGDTPPIQPDDLEARIAKELKHTLKLVPQSQRELFTFELARWHQQALERERLEARVDEVMKAQALNLYTSPTGHHANKRLKQHCENRLSTLTNKDKDNDK